MDRTEVYVVTAFFCRRLTTVMLTRNVRDVRRRRAALDSLTHVRNRTCQLAFASNTPGEGSPRSDDRLRLRQPSNSERRCRAIGVENTTTRNSSGPVILVVEDEHLLCAYASGIIKDAGFDVVEARNADEAIVILEARKDIRIVFTDIEMPGSMDGLRLAKAIRDRWPPIELILTSGKMRLPKPWLPERGHFLPKPYQPDNLLSAIKSFIAP
jgi:CheY-like chemotaxis protein